MGKRHDLGLSCGRAWAWVAVAGGWGMGHRASGVWGMGVWVSGGGSDHSCVVRLSASEKEKKQYGGVKRRLVSMWVR